jgi:hypothetical protein
MPEDAKPEPPQQRRMPVAQAVQLIRNAWPRLSIQGGTFADVQTLSTALEILMAAASRQAAEEQQEHA